MLDLAPDKKKEKYSSILKKLMKHMAEADLDDDQKNSMAEHNSKDDEEHPSEENEAPMEVSSESADEESESDGELDAETIKEMLGSRNKIPKKEGMVSVSFVSESPLKSKMKGRPKGSKGKF